MLKWARLWGCVFIKEDGIRSRIAWKQLYMGDATNSHLLTYRPIRNSEAVGPVGSTQGHLFYLTMPCLGH